MHHKKGVVEWLTVYVLSSNPSTANKQMKAIMVPAKTRHIDQWNRTENLEISPHSYSWLIFDKAAKSMYWRKVREWKYNGGVSMFKVYCIYVWNYDNEIPSYY
jgi:hypothetical protein